MRRLTLLTISIFISLFCARATLGQQTADDRPHPKAAAEQEAKMSCRLQADGMERMSNYGPQLPRKAYEAILGPREKERSRRNLEEARATE